jgi:hypothetical protein
MLKLRSAVLIGYSALFVLPAFGSNVVIARLLDWEGTVVNVDKFVSETGSGYWITVREGEPGDWAAYEAMGLDIIERQFYIQGTPPKTDNYIYVYVEVDTTGQKRYLWSAEDTMDKFDRRP